MVTMFEKQQAQGAETLKPGCWHIADWAADILVVRQHIAPEQYTVLLLNDEGNVLAQCSWYAGEGETFAEPIRILRDADILPEDEPSYQIVRYVAANEC